MNVLLRSATALALAALATAPVTSLATVRAPAVLADAAAVTGDAGPDPAGSPAVPVDPHQVCAWSMVWDSGCSGPR
jgi:hypothetical protein